MAKKYISFYQFNKWQKNIYLSTSLINGKNKNLSIILTRFNFADIKKNSNKSILNFNLLVDEAKKHDWIDDTNFFKRTFWEELINRLTLFKYHREYHDT